MESLEQDYHNFSTSSSHRLPTLSGAQAIRIALHNARPIPTSLPSLDTTLGKASSHITTTTTAGLQRGVVTEVFGPPGVGKTTFALQVAVNALHASTGDSRVTWIDTFSQLVPSRLQQIAEGYRLPLGDHIASSPPQPQGAKDVLLAERFSYLHVASLPKLLTLFLHATPSFPPQNTSVIVIDDLPNLILSSLPRTSHSVSRDSSTASDAARDAALAKRALSRRFQVLSSFASGLQKFAAANNVAVLVTSKATVNLKAGQKAVLRPALTSQQWDNYLSARISLYRDFWPDDALATQTSTNGARSEPTELERRSLRFAKVIRLGGKLVSGPEVGFVIEERGLREIKFADRNPDVPLVPLATQPLPALEDVIEVETGQKVQLSDGLGDEVDELEDHTVEETASEPPVPAKRKAIEIDDSDDNEDGDSDSDLSLPPDASQSGGFKPSSDALHADPDAAVAQSAAMAKKLRFDTTRLSIANEAEAAEPDEMLLEMDENRTPLFSQAAADMSEPLTPSDDGRDSS